MIDLHCAPGIHRIEDAHTNWYLVEEGSRLTVVDTGFPRSWHSLRHALQRLGRTTTDIEAIVLTHGHFDHMGFARRAQEIGIPVWAHSREIGLITHPWRYDHERGRASYLRHPEFVRILAEMTAQGALWVRGTDSVRAFEPDRDLDVPGRPRPLFTPGHTHGHCSLVFADRGAVIVGDAFVTLDPYTGRNGPCVVAGAATADSRQAMSSLEVLAQADSAVALTGHGPPWTGSMRDAIDQARAAGPA